MGLFGNLFGGEDRKKAADAQESAAAEAKKAGAAARQVAGEAGRRAGQMGAEADRYAARTQSDLGTGAADFMRLQDEAARKSAGEEAQTASTGSARQALKAAKTAGLTPGQAALLAGRGTADTYTGALQKGMDTGRSRYGQATELGMRQGSDMAGREATARGQQVGAIGAQTGAAGVQSGVGAQQAQAGQNQRQSIFGGIGKVAGALGSIFSDEDLKYDIEECEGEWNDRKTGIDELIAKVKPVSFRYKNEGSDEQKHEGVIAQDLEDTELGKDAVHDSPMGKYITADDLKPLLVDLVKELNKRARD